MIAEVEVEADLLDGARNLTRYISLRPDQSVLIHT